jgi:hypothetical protein
VEARCTIGRVITEEDGLRRVGSPSPWFSDGMEIRSEGDALRSVDASRLVPGALAASIPSDGFIVRVALDHAFARDATARPRTDHVQQ